MRARISGPKPLPSMGTARGGQGQEGSHSLGGVRTQPNLSQQMPPTMAPMVTKMVKATIRAPVAAPRSTP